MPFVSRAQDQPVAPSPAAPAKADEAAPARAMPPDPVPRRTIEGKPVAALPPKSDELEIRLMGSEEAPATYSIFEEEGTGKIVGVFASPMRLTYVASNLTLMASAAVVWVTPGSSNATDEESKPDGDKPRKSSLDLGARFLSDIAGIEVYAEGDIWLRVGSDTAVRADRVYLDLIRGTYATFSLRGVIDNPKGHTSLGELDAMRTGETTDAPAPNVRQGQDFKLENERFLFLRAARLRVLDLSPQSGGRKTFELENGSVTTSSLANPDYSLGATRIRVSLAPERREMVLDNPFIEIMGTRAFTVPAREYVYDLDSEIPEIGLSFSRSEAFGTTLRARLDVITAYDFIFDPIPAFRPFKLIPYFDYYTERGLGTGGAAHAGELKPFHTGYQVSLTGYYIGDRGDRREIARELGLFPLEQSDRGRVKGYLSARPGDGFQLDANADFVSDEHFLEEFYRREFLSNEQRRSFLRVAKQAGNRAFYAEARMRLRDFEDEIEHLPLTGFGTWREPVGPPAAGLQLTSEGTFAVHRFRRHLDQVRFNNLNFLRADAMMRVDRPFDFGVFVVDPYAGLRVTGSDVEVDAAGNPLFDPFIGFRPPAAGRDAVRDRNVGRFLTMGGASIETNFVRTWREAALGAFDIRGVRHVVTPRVSWDNVFTSSTDAAKFLQIDETAALDMEQRLTLSLRNRIQTRRRLAKLGYQTTDAFELLFEAPVYPNSRRDNGGQHFGDIEIAAALRPFGRMAIGSTAFFEPRHWNWQRFYTGVSLDLDEVDLGVSYRALREQHGVITGRVTAHLSESYDLEAKQEYDVRLGRARDSALAISRSVISALAVRVEVRRDAVTQDLSFHLSLSASFDTSPE